MKKLLAILAAAAAVSASAQTPESQTVIVSDTEDGYVTTTVTESNQVQLNPFKDNWFVSAGVGAQFYAGDCDQYMAFGDRLAPALDINVGKWFSPSFGLFVGYSGIQAKGLYMNTYPHAHGATGKLYTGKLRGDGAKYPDKWYEQKNNFFNLHINAMVDLCNLIGGYKQDRFYSLIPYVGVGWLRSYGGDHAFGDNEHGNDIAFNVGLQNRFRLSDAWSLNLNLRATFTDDSFDGEISGGSFGPHGLEDENVNFDGLFGATIGVTYHFKQRGWNRSTNTLVEVVNTGDQKRLMQEVNNLRAQNAQLQSELNAKPKEVAKSDVITFPYLVNFQIDKTDVVNRELVNLQTVADMIKATPNLKYSVTGYADKQTGTAERNKWLAEHRADNVYNILVNDYGVPASQLILDSKGGVDYMYYDDPQLSRSVIISVAK